MFWGLVCGVVRRFYSRSGVGKWWAVDTSARDSRVEAKLGVVASYAWNSRRMWLESVGLVACEPFHLNSTPWRKRVKSYLSPVDLIGRDMFLWKWKSVGRSSGDDSRLLQEILVYARPGGQNRARILRRHSSMITMWEYNNSVFPRTKTPPRRSTEAWRTRVAY